MPAKSALSEKFATRKAKRPAVVAYRSADVWTSVGSDALSVIPEPQFKKLRFPKNLTTKSDKALGHLMSYYTEMSGYYDTILARAEIDYATAKMQNSFARSKALLRARGATISERRAHRTTRSAVIRASREVLKCRALYVMLLTYRRVCDKYINCVSREITRREPQRMRNNGR